MTERYLDLNGTTLFVDDRGDPRAPALLYVHGGPGMSCFDFMAVQGDRLAGSLRLVGVDQRGVLRSGPVGTQPLTIETLIADFEAVRDRLGISSWTVLGHSAGGSYVLDYALEHPETVGSVIFDCPCWDADSTDRHRLPVAADLLQRYGHTEEAARCRELAAFDRRLTAADETHAAVQALGERYQELFFHDSEAQKRFEHLLEGSGLGDESWARGTSHATLMEDLYVDRMPLLAKLAQPSLLQHGAHDLVTSPQMIERYRSDVPTGSVVTFEESGHFCHHEQPELYADTVATFVKEQAR